MLNPVYLREGEKILMSIRRHWIMNVLTIFYFVLCLIISFIIYLILGFNILSNFIITLFWLSASLVLYVQWLNSELDLYLITSCRIISVEQVSFLDRTISECGLGQVQEVNSQTRGIFANILNYGTLSIQTAGSVNTMIMNFCPDVIHTARKILNTVNNYKDEKLRNNNPVNSNKYEGSGKS